jgi:hypothetical protein
MKRCVAAEGCPQLAGSGFAGGGDGKARAMTDGASACLTVSDYIEQGRVVGDSTRWMLC